MRNIENPAIVRTVYSKTFQEYSGIFRDIQQYSAMFRPILDIFRHTEGHRDIFRHYLCHIKHIQKSCIYNRAIWEPQHIYRNCGIFKSLSKTCIIHVRWSAVFEFWHSQNSLFMHLQGYSGIFMETDALSVGLKHHFFCKTLHLKFLTVFKRHLCFNNSSVIYTVTLCYVYWKF